MRFFHNPFARLSAKEWGLYLLSATIVLLSALCGKTTDLLSLCTSLIGVTALIFLAGGDVWGQVLTCVFAVLYALLSLRLSYFSEALTYLGLSAPIAFVSILSWMRHPSEACADVVEIHALSKKDIVALVALTPIVTVGGAVLLAYLQTPLLLVSTFSIATSFLAAALMFLRSPYYAIAYAANDIVLIVLWAAASLHNLSYLTVVACFAAFLANDIYGFFSWRGRAVRK